MQHYTLTKVTVVLILSFLIAIALMALGLFRPAVAY
jgi:hypothetical protein